MDCQCARLAQFLSAMSHSLDFFDLAAEAGDSAPSRSNLWVSALHRIAFIANMLRWYQHALRTRPLLTQSLTTSFLFAAGDGMAQHLVEKVDRHDYGRTGRMALYGGAIFGPAATKWFGFLQNRVRIPSSPNLEILARVGLDQVVFASTNMAVFLSSMAIMEGKSAKEKLESTYTNALTKNWMVWPFVQMVNFKFVPLEARVLVVNIVSLGWNCYLSYLNSGGGTTKEEKELSFT